MKTQHIDLTPSWVASTKIFIAVLENPKASYEGRKVARAELTRMAEIVDNLNKKKEEQS